MARLAWPCDPMRQSLVDALCREEDVQIDDSEDRGDLLATYYADATKGADRCGLACMTSVVLHTWLLLLCSVALRSDMPPFDAVDP